MNPLRYALPFAAALGLGAGPASSAAPGATAGGTVSVALLCVESCEISRQDIARSTPDISDIIDDLGALVAQCSPGVGAFEIQSEDTRRGYAVGEGGSLVVVPLAPEFHIRKRPARVSAPSVPGSPNVHWITFVF